MAISRNQLVKELEPGLNALFGLEYKQYENQSADIYTTEGFNGRLFARLLKMSVPSVMCWILFFFTNFHFFFINLIY